MKKRGLLNAPLSQVVAQMGHGDLLVIADAGLPIPPAVQRIDLAVRPGLPSFLDVLDAVLEELHVEKAVVAVEMRDRSPTLYSAFRERLASIPLEHVPHETFKAMTASARAVVRTGECTPYANVILVSGVIF
ncbi:D-ribose pyranase [Candidatus Thermoflexus japonica]|uniref:D-ribose pyranase n=1 Tax=Candidatus Thermoflexus japonica TaxID=2035417 RepID=A0A2H5Y7I0_9CHLR|nr:D-ribose pyranase [Candidatus Thermoflexus japonica]